MIHQLLRRLALGGFMVLMAAGSALAQAPDDEVLNPVQPDFTVVSLPTSLRMPSIKGAFRVTHRFIRPINCDDPQRCPDNLLEDLFGMDQGAYIGLEYRMGIITNLQAGVHRARGDKTIDIFGEYGLTRQGEGMPFELATRVSIEGTNNFMDVYSPTITVIVTREMGARASVHVEPIWVGNSNLSSDDGDDSTMMIGLAGRLRVRPTVYLVGEFVPRIAGYKPGTDHAAFSIEKRAGAHLFQLTFSNSFATTIGQIARGAQNSHDWFMGFNLSRKFY